MLADLCSNRNTMELIMYCNSVAEKWDTVLPGILEFDNKAGLPLGYNALVSPHLVMTIIS